MKKLISSRRQFLRTAVFAAGVPFILPSRVWSAEVSPSRRITLGFIGVGKQGRGLLGGFLGKKECQSVAVCDVDTTRRNAAKQQVEDYYAKQSGADFRGCTATADFRELLARKDIDAVVIATPDHWHAFLSIAAANAGKDIYCEKPLCQSIHEGRAMVKAVRKNRRIFQTGSMQRSSREFRVACELVRNGVIGKLITVRVGVGGPGRPCDLPEEPAEPGLDWNMWLGPAALRPYNSVLSPRGVHNHFPHWRLYREFGGGGVTDWGAHHFDIAQWGLGMDASGPVEIIPPAEWQTAQQGVRLRYGNLVEVQHVNENGVTFDGLDGTIFVNRGKFSLELNGKWLADNTTKGSKASLTQQLEAVEQAFPIAAKHQLYRSTDHKADWLDCVATGKRPITDVEVGARSVTVCHLVNLAYYHGVKLEWNPAKEQFVGNAGNPAWLDVPQREPWITSGLS